MQINPYLNFDGRCAAAFKLYEKCLGGELMMQTFGDSPMADQAPPDWRDRIMHASLKVGDALLMGSDAPPSRFQKPQGFAVSLQLKDPAEAERIYRALSEGGTVEMPLQETFWAARFGMFTDPFGIHWMINCEKGS
jgi:PhnB protein